MSPLPFSGPRLGLGLLLLVDAVLLFILIGAVAGGSDNSGYFNEARLISQGRLHVAQRTLASLPVADTPGYLYTPLGFRPAVDGTRRLVPTYPPGLPLLLVPASWIAGWPHAGDLVLLLHSLAGIALTYALARHCGLAATWSLLAAIILAASPLYLFLSLQALSDVPAAVWATAAVVAALRCHGRPGWALVAGVSISVGFLVRPTNCLIGLPVLLAIGWSPRRLALVAAGSLPGIVALLAVNHAAYGNAFVSGYGAVGQEFHSDLVTPTFAFYAKWLPLLLSPVIMLAPFVLLLGRSKPRVVTVLFVWASAFILFYSAYRWTHEDWWFLRFLLPAAPALIVAGLLTCHRGLAAAERRLGARARILVPAAVLVLAVGVEATRHRQLSEAWVIGHGERKYGRVAAWLNAHVAPTSVLITSQASGALFYFTDFTLLKLQELNPALTQRILTSVKAERRDTYAVLFPYEVSAINALPGRWTHVVSIDDVGIWRGEPAAGRLAGGAAP